MKHLDITFLQENSSEHGYSDSKPLNFDIKFPLYMKHL